MPIRTTIRTVTFMQPFILGGFDEVLPAGTYEVETDEELLDGPSFLAYRRVETLLHLPAVPGHHDLARTLSVDPNELEAALKRDQASTTAVADDVASAEGTDAHEEQKTDRQAVDRAEDEGMTVHSRYPTPKPG